MNKILLMGRLTAEAVLKKSTKDKSKTYAKFSLAVPRKLEKDKTDFFDCVSFGRVGEAISKYCQKGSRISIVGNMQIDNYTDKDGNSRKSYTVIVEDFYFADNKANKKEDNTEDVSVLPF